MPDETLDPRHTALVYFDTLKVYAYDRELKTVVPEAQAQVEALVRLNKLARVAGLPVFYARADHRPDGKDGATALTDLELARPERPAAGGGEGFGRQVWGTEASTIIDEIAPQPSDYQVFKHRWNMFFLTDLELSLRARDIDTILLAGGSTEVGVASSAYAARDLDFHTVIVREAQRSGRGRWITDFFVDQVAPGFTRVRSLAQVAAMLRAGGATVPEESAKTAPTPTPPPTLGEGQGERASSTDPPPVAGPPSSEPSLDPKSTGLLLFDVLKGGNYDRETRKLSERAAPTIAATQHMVQAARRAGVPVLYAQANHRPDGADWASALNDRDDRRRENVFGRSRIRPGSFQGSWEAEIVDELAPEPGDYVVKKHRWSAFHGTHLELSLRTAGITDLLLAGGSTAVGIASTAYSARDRDLNLVVLRDACRGATPEIDAYFMDHVFPRMGRVRTVDSAIGLLEASQ